MRTDSMDTTNAPIMPLTLSRIDFLLPTNPKLRQHIEVSNKGCTFVLKLDPRMKEISSDDDYIRTYNYDITLYTEERLISLLKRYETYLNFATIHERD